MAAAVDTTYKPLCSKPLLEVPLIMVGDIPLGTSSEETVSTGATTTTERKLKPCIRYDRSLSDPM